MEMVYERCCGIDVHKKMIMACFRNGRKSDTRSFGTLTSEIKKLCTWLEDQHCQMIAMESTGVY